MAFRTRVFPWLIVFSILACNLARGMLVPVHNFSFSLFLFSSVAHMGSETANRCRPRMAGRLAGRLVMFANESWTAQGRGSITWLYEDT